MKIGVVMGSDSDFVVLKKSLKVLKEFDVKAEVRVLSAHRTSDERQVKQLIYLVF